MIKYKEGKNFDRLVGLGSALLYDYYLTSKHIFPKVQAPRSQEEIRKEVPKKPINRGFFHSTRRKMF